MRKKSFRHFYVISMSFNLFKAKGLHSQVLKTVKTQQKLWKSISKIFFLQNLIKLIFIHIHSYHKCLINLRTDCCTVNTFHIDNRLLQSCDHSKSTNKNIFEASQLRNSFMHADHENEEINWAMIRFGIFSCISLIDVAGCLGCLCQREVVSKLDNLRMQSLFWENREIAPDLVSS